MWEEVREEALKIRHLETLWLRNLCNLAAAFTYFLTCIDQQELKSYI